MTIDALHKLFLTHLSVSTDTRKIKPGDLFFALKGDSFNGNHFAEKALHTGASYAIIDESEFDLNNGKTILVENVLKTLQKLATFHRKYLGLPIIALTGSNGKTTTKELIHTVLSQKYNTVSTMGNLNNHIGVPLTLLSMNETTEIGVVEMGANHPGEIDFLCQIAHPDYGYITNFGKAHLEGFGSLEGVIKAKTELYRYLKAHNKIVFVNTNDKEQVAQSLDLKKITFGTEPQNDSTIANTAPTSAYVSISYKSTIINSQLVGQYNFSNIGAAIAIGVFFDVAESDIKKGIENYTPKNSRSQIVAKNSNTILLDAYNANPTSMEAALENFNQWEVKGKCLFLGDMFEIGETASTEHQKIVEIAATMNFEQVILVGKNFYNTQITQPSVLKYLTFDDLKNSYNFSAIKNSHILIKGSRGMAMERILELLE